MEQKIKSVEDKYKECLDKIKAPLNKFIEDKEKLYELR